MKATLISKENNQAKLEMAFTAEEFEAAINKAYKANRNKYSVDGFRKGKAPRSILERRYGEDLFYQDAIYDMLNSNYKNVLDENDLEVIDNPQVDFDLVASGQPLTMKIDVALFPIIDVDGYLGIDVEQYKVNVTDEDVNNDIESLRKRNARIVSVDREAKEGDTVVLDYAGFVGDEQFEGGTAEGHELKLGSKTFIPGFEDQLIGIKAGESCDVNVTFPEKYQAEKLAGKDAVFHCTVHEVKEEQLPELDDEFVKDVSEYDTVDELKEETRKRLLAQREDNAVAMAKNMLMDKVADLTEYELPAVMVEDEVDRMITEFGQQLMYQGMDLDLYLKYMGLTRETFRDTVKPDAEKRVKERIVIRSIADKEGIVATEADVDEELGKMAEAYGMEVDKMKESFGKEFLESMKKDVIVMRTLDFLFDKANVVITDAPEVKEVKAEAEEEAEAEEKTEE
ncbi:MAG: trigger factor [Eubacterium sp.]|nr:trigger factor [Eubacterium sp.]